VIGLTLGSVLAIALIATVIMLASRGMRNKTAQFENDSFSQSDGSDTTGLHLKPKPEPYMILVLFSEQGP